MLLNYGVGMTLERPLNYMEMQPVHPKGNKSWIFIGRTDSEAETPIFGHLMRRTDSVEKTLILGKIEGRRGRGQQRMRSLAGITDMITWIWVSSGSWWWTGKPGMLQSMGLQKVGHDWVTELNWVVILYTYSVYIHIYICIYTILYYITYSFKIKIKVGRDWNHHV